jgi:hypothetical protein
MIDNLSMSPLAASPPPSLGELGTILKQRRQRREDELRRQRAEILSRLASRLYDLRFERPPSSPLTEVESTVLAWIEEVNRTFDDARALIMSYEAGMTRSQQEAEQARQAFDGSDPLTKAIEKQRHLEAFLQAQMEVEVYQESLRTLRQELEASERGYTVMRPNLLQDLERYADNKLDTLRRELEQQIDTLAGTARRILAIRQRIQGWTGTFGERYKLALRPRQVVIEPPLPEIPESGVCIVEAEEKR